MTSVETSILIFLVVGAGITAGVFLIARTAVQLASVAYRVMERQLTRGAATHQTALLSAAMLAALIVTALVGGYAIYAIFATLLDTSGALNTLNSGS